MKTLLGIPMVAVLLTVLSVNTSFGACCGAVSYRRTVCCDPCSYSCAQQQCHTVMKTCRKVVHEQEQYTCYKTCYETVYEDKQVDCVKYVRETKCREEQYTVCKPVRETHYRTV